MPMPCTGRPMFSSRESSSSRKCESVRRSASSDTIAWGARRSWLIGTHTPLILIVMGEPTERNRSDACFSAIRPNRRSSDVVVADMTGRPWAAECTAYGGRWLLANPSDRMKRGQKVASGGGMRLRAEAATLRGCSFAVHRPSRISPGGPSDFLCFAKESHQRKATARGRPPATLALRAASAGRARNSPDHAARATGSDTRPALPRCRRASRRRPRADSPRRRANSADAPTWDAFEGAEQRSGRGGS